MDRKPSPPPAKTVPPEPRSTTPEKPSIRKSQEEFIGDEAAPSRDKSEVDAPAADASRQSSKPR